jgi:hypothetical protein
MDQSSEPIKPKSWWAPLWRGLIDDPQGKHCKQMDGAIWLYLHLLLHANRKTGKTIRRYQAISQEIGCPQATIRRWLRILNKYHYVAMQRHSSGAMLIEIQKWKPLPAFKQSNHI